MNFHSDEHIQRRVQDHYDMAVEYYGKDRVLGAFYHGAANYGLDTENSDVDTKLVVLPSLRDMAFNKKPISTTLVLENNEHIDPKDVRLMIDCFKKQNVNFLEILFTKYYEAHWGYHELWDRLMDNREKIARYNPQACAMTMFGVAVNKFERMEHWTASKDDVFNKYQYDPKELHHLVRIEEFLERYIAGESFEACLQSRQPGFLKQLKTDPLDLDEARALANIKMDKIEMTHMPLVKGLEQDLENKKFVDELFDKVLYTIIEFSVRKELDL